MEENYEHYVPQVFIYFTFKDIDFEFQYTHINDLNLYCSRISNCSLYSKLTKENNKVLIAEIPLSANNELWSDDNKLRDLAWDEIVQCGIIKKDVKFKNTKVVKIAKTFRVPKINFFNFLNEIELNLKNKFGSNVNMLGQGIFTRHKFVKELLNKLK